MREAEVIIGDGDLDAMGIDELVRVFRAADIQDFEELDCQGDGGVVRVTVASRVDPDVLSSFDYVEAWERIAETSSAFVYLVEFTAPALSADLAGHADNLVGTCDPDVDDEGVRMSLVGDQDAIADAVSGYESAGVSPRLDKLGEYNGEGRPLDVLTDRQRAVIQTAYDMGYYAVPREASTADVAAEFDVDDSTVAEHLQRAERNLLSLHLDAAGESESTPTE